MYTYENTTLGDAYSMTKDEGLSVHCHGASRTVALVDWTEEDEETDCDIHHQA